MKRQNDGGHHQGDGATGERMTPLEERVLRMHLGVTEAHCAHLADGSRGQRMLGYSLRGIEAQVLLRARQPRASLRVVTDPFEP